VSLPGTQLKNLKQRHKIMQLKFELFHEQNFTTLCDKLSRKDKDLKKIIKQYGYPPMWTRPATFQSLILFILEQQVSLASAYAAFKKLKERIGFVTPSKILSLTDEELRACYFSRQKIVYARELANAVKNKKLILKRFHNRHEDEIRLELKKIKGIGDWTVDVYLMHSLQRTDLFPLGDIALVNSLKETKQLHPHISREEMLAIAESWRPYRTIASMILWHAYIKKRNIKLQG
jgi:DNA-3-methyladenine glycosylase II